MTDRCATVVVVDDLRAFRQAMVDVVEATRGFVLAGQGSSGEEAIALVEVESPALVVMDVIMPGIGGITAAEIIRRRFPRTLVILLSAYDSDLLPARLSQCGAVFQQKDRFGPRELERIWQASSRTRG